MGYVPDDPDSFTIPAVRGINLFNQVGGRNAMTLQTFGEGTYSAFMNVYVNYLRLEVE